MSGFTTYEDSEEVHVYSEEEEDQHQMTKFCTCEPYIDRTPDGRLLVNHATESVEERKRKKAGAVPRF